MGSIQDAADEMQKELERAAGIVHETPVTRFRREKTCAIAISGTFDQVLSILALLPPKTEASLAIWLALKEPDADRRFEYQLPVLTLDRGATAKQTVEKLFRQARITTEEYNDVMAKLEQIQAIMNK